MWSKQIICEQKWIAARYLLRQHPEPFDLGLSRLPRLVDRVGIRQSQEPDRVAIGELVAPASRLEALKPGVDHPASIPRALKLPVQTGPMQTKELRYNIKPIPTNQGVSSLSRHVDQTSNTNPIKNPCKT